MSEPIDVEHSIVPRSVITKAHTVIGNQFISTVVDRLSSTGFKVKKYAVDTEYRNRETIHIKFEDDTEIQIQLDRP